MSGKRFLNRQITTAIAPPAEIEREGVSTSINPLAFR
jgi:hypothetical protein